MNSIFVPGSSGQSPSSIDDSSAGRIGLGLSQGQDVPSRTAIDASSSSSVSQTASVATCIPRHETTKKLGHKERGAREKSSYSKLEGESEERSETEKSKGRGKGKAKKSDDSNDMSEIKEQLKKLMGLVPVIEKMKEAYDAFNENDDGEEEISAIGLSRPELRKVAVDGPIASTSDAGFNNSHSNFDPSAVDERIMVSPSVADLVYFENVAGTAKAPEINISQNIAMGVEKVLTGGMPLDTYMKLVEKYNTPTNCERLSVMMCNEEVFKNATGFCRARDSSLQKVQNILVKGLTAVTFALDLMVSKSKNNDDSLMQDGKLMEYVSDGVALLANASHHLDIFRRQAFKGEIKEEYISLCNASHPVSGRLFGDNVGEKIKDLNESMKVAKSARRFHPYRRNRFPFLDKGQPWRQRGGGNATPRRYQNQWNPNQNQRKPRRKFN